MGFSTQLGLSSWRLDDHTGARAVKGRFTQRLSVDGDGVLMCDLEIVARSRGRDAALAHMSRYARSSDAIIESSTRLHQIFLSSEAVLDFISALESRLVDYDDLAGFEGHFELTVEVDGARRLALHFGDSSAMEVKPGMAPCTIAYTTNDMYYEANLVVDAAGLQTFVTQMQDALDGRAGAHMLN